MLKVNELFSGIGAQSAALKRLGIDFKVVGIAEIDKYAIKSYEAMHGSARNYGDISKIDKLDYADFWTYSFPCQDISVAGKQAGIEKGKTRSGLLYEVERLLEKSIECGEQPKWLMLENVKNLIGKQFKPKFEEWVSRLNDLGYNTYWKVLNAKNYGIPQNRERVFAISIRKDIDNGYEFPEPFDNGKRLKDVLETEVDEKFYLSDKTMKSFNKLLAEVDNNINQVGMLDIRGNEQIRRVYGDNGISPTLNTMQGGNRQPKVLIPQATKQGYIECNVPGVADLSFLDSKTRRGRVQENGEICPTLMAGAQDICYIDMPCIAASRGRYGDDGNTEQKLEANKTGNTNTITSVQKDNYVVESPCRIRKLTPLECWRLMGFSDEDFRKAEAVNSNSQLYKQAGNSIVVDVLYYQFKNLFKEHHTAKIVYMDNSDQLEGQMDVFCFIGR